MTLLALRPRSAVGREQMDWPELPPNPYLDRHAPDDVRVRGTRVDLSVVVEQYTSGRVPEETTLEYPTLTAEAVYGVIAYYLGNREAVDRYVALTKERARARRDAHLALPDSPLRARLKAFRTTRQSA